MSSNESLPPPPLGSTWLIAGIEEFDKFGFEAGSMLTKRRSASSAPPPEFSQSCHSLSSYTSSTKNPVHTMKVVCTVIQHVHTQNVEVGPLQDVISDKSTRYLLGTVVEPLSSRHSV